MVEQPEQQLVPDVDEEPVDVAPYGFSRAHVAFAVQVVDLAVSGGADSWTAARAAAEAEAPEELGDITELRRELCRALTYSLHMGLGDEDPGCELNVAGNGLLPAVRTLPDPVVQLWLAVADSVREPAAIARFRDLLWCRRGPRAGLHAERAAHAYLQLVDAGDIGMRGMEFLLRAWTLARQVKNADLDRQIRSRLAQVAEDTITQHPGARPGILLPTLSALARGPLREKKAPPASDPIDVDDLLDRAAGVCARGNDATAVARYRRSRTTDPATLEAIARAEATAYFRDADTAPHPAVRMGRLNSAAQIARVRGLGDLERRAAAAMQNIDSASMPWQTITASAEVPPYAIEPFLSAFTRPTRWPDAMDEFLLSECPTGDVAEVRTQSAASQSIFSRILPPVRFAGGLPRAKADTDADFDNYQLSLYAQVRAENYGRLLATGLYRFAERYGTPTEDDLVDYFLTRGARDPALVRSLAKAFRHFWNDDTESCIHLATPKVETAARALLIELDEGIYRAEAANAPGGYPGLYPMLNKLEDIALDESWAYFSLGFLPARGVRTCATTSPTAYPHRSHPPTPYSSCAP